MSEIAHKWAGWQSEVGKLIFWVRNSIRKKNFHLANSLVPIFFLQSHLLNKKNLRRKLNSKIKFFLLNNLLRKKYFYEVDYLV